jgi:hypothetical protein
MPERTFAEANGPKGTPQERRVIHPDLVSLIKKLKVDSRGMTAKVESYWSG